MTPADSMLRSRSPRGLLALGLLAAAGLAVGWFMVPRHARTFACAYALLDPACVAAVCVSALSHNVKHSRWLVPLLLAGVMSNVVFHPHDTVFTAIGLAAGALGVFASVFGRNRAAIGAALLCCGAICGALLVGLLRASG